MRFLWIVSFLMGCSCWTSARADEWEPIGSLPYEASLRHFFQAIPSGDPCADLAGWKAIEGVQNARASISRGKGRKPEEKAIAISYEFVGKNGLEYVAVSVPLKIDKPGHYLAVWAKGVGDGGKLRFRVRDRTGEIHQGDLGQIKDDQWQFHMGPVKDSAGAWAGDGNKKLDYPCTLQSILLDRPQKGYKGKGTLTLAGLTLMRRKRPPKEVIRMSVPKGHFGNVFRPDESPRLRIDRTKDAGKETLLVKYRVLDYWDRKRGDGEFFVSTEGQELSFESIGPGYYRCVLEAYVDGEPTEAIEARFAVIAPPVPLKQVQESFFAVCTHYRGTAWPLESQGLIARAGIKAIRDEMSWGRVEQKKGVFEFDPRFDEYVDHALSLGIEPMIILDYANRHYDGGNFPVSDEAVKGFARYCHEVVKRYKGKIRYFEVWNEWSGGCGMRGKKGNTPENYARLIAAAYPAIKKANPNAFVIGVGGDHSKHHFDKIEAMFKAGALKHMDAVSVHSYRYPRTPEATDLIGEIMDVKKLIEKYGGKQRIWITEIGWPTHIGSTSSTEQHQARMFVRTHVQMMATQVVDRIFWYDFKDDGLDRFYNECNFGIVRHQKFHCAPKSAYVACAVLSRLLTNAKFAGREKLGRGVLAYRFHRPDGSDLVVAWAPEGEKDVWLPWKVQRVTDIMGSEQEARTSWCRLTGDPVYIALARR
ncbi:MAG: cellulase family glycosylhydrolase [Planctomycetes bacterium]|nr:cellulase family glycosylhydrolase [Planctomycetota bacterium]